MAEKKYIEVEPFRDKIVEMICEITRKNDSKVLSMLYKVQDIFENEPAVDSVEVFDHTATETAYRNGFEAGKKARDEEIEANGEWVHLPCKVGDTVYIIKYYCDYNACSMQERASCCGCRGYRDNKYIVCSKTFDLSDAKQIGKTIFLTREEAVSALEKMKGEKE